MKKILMFAVTAALVFGLLACGEKEEETVTVQSVGMITGHGSAMVSEHFSGIVSVRSEVKVDPERGKTVSKILVEAGDEVKKGDVLFQYDMELLSLDLEKAELELEQMKSARDAKVRERDELAKQKEQAKQEDQLAYTLEIQGCDTEIREAEYNIALKEKDVERLKEALDVTEVYAPVAGTIQKVNEPGDSESGESEGSLITIVESGDYRVKGYVNESNAGLIEEGMPVLIRSRMDRDAVWQGEISGIEWDAPEKQQNSNAYFGDMSADSEMETTSKYPFYVELKSAEGLLLGQHVYIEPDYGQAELDPNALYLPEFYLTEIQDESAVVYARNAGGKLEKRTVSLGDYKEDLVSYEILSGLDFSDYIAFPDEKLKEGMKCVEFDENSFDGGEAEDGNFDDGFYEDDPEGSFEGGNFFDPDVEVIEDKAEDVFIEEESGK